MQHLHLHLSCDQLSFFPQFPPLQSWDIVSASLITSMRLTGTHSGSLAFVHDEVTCGSVFLVFIYCFAATHFCLQRLESEDTPCSKGIAKLCPNLVTWNLVNSA